MTFQFHFMPIDPSKHFLSAPIFPKLGLLQLLVHTVNVGKSGSNISENLASGLKRKIKLACNYIKHHFTIKTEQLLTDYSKYYAKL